MTMPFNFQNAKNVFFKKGQNHLGLNLSANKPTPRVNAKNVIQGKKIEYWALLGYFLVKVLFEAKNSILLVHEVSHARKGILTDNTAYASLVSKIRQIYAKFVS